MSKSLGNFFTLRDLVLKGHKPSSIRFLLASVPYRNQLNFTFDGLKQAAVSVERLRNFQLRLMAGQFPAGATEGMADLARETAERMRAGMDDDLNTAQAQAAIFDMVRKVNAAMDAGQFKKDDVPALLAALQKFDELFAVLKDDDAPKIRSIVEWAKAEGRENEISKELLETVGRAATLRRGNRKEDRRHGSGAPRRAISRPPTRFVRNSAAIGIVVEITKDGARWKRK